ncbi:MAG TPA: hypothetical protein VFV97_10110, partial [Rhodanobacteraceae bacterium]|nr:hypothetical protein [Rhodanobacteraceae bacterium]
ASLGPVLWYHWIPLAAMEAEVGDMEGARKSVASFHRDIDEYGANLADNDPRHALLESTEGLDALVQLIGGSPQPAYATAVKVIEQVRAVETPERGPAKIMQTAILRSNLDTAAIAGIRTGHYREAEAFAAQLKDIVPDSTNQDDPRQRAAHCDTLRAHAIAMQGRGEEALAIVASALEYYRDEAKNGAATTWFLHEYAYALTVSAIARTDMPAERAKRTAELDDAVRVLDGASAEAKRMASYRELSSLIARARG